MKKLTTIFTACLFVFALSSCGGNDDGSDASGSENSEKDDKTEKDNCYQLVLDDLNKQTRPEVFADMGVPSDEEIANCICSELPDMTDEELIEWLEDGDDFDPINNEEDRKKMEFQIRCIGFDSFEDYMGKMTEMMQKQMMQAETDLE